MENSSVVRSYDILEYDNNDDDVTVFGATF